MKQVRRILNVALGVALALMWFVAFSVHDSRAVTCSPGDKCLCVQTVVDTCADNGGQPSWCDSCRGLFQPCWDKYCDYNDYRCASDANGSTSCTETLVSVVKGLHRSCTGSAIDWFNCLGQPKCVSAYIENVAGNRYTCSTNGS